MATTTKAKPKAAQNAAQSRRKILAASGGWLGVKYRWAGASRAGVDCSGLTMNVYRAAGILLPHNSAAQALLGRKVSQGQAQPGDLVFFGKVVISHVGIWLGGGMVRHAPHTGTVVRDESLSSIAGTVPLRGFRNYLGDIPSSSTGDVLTPPPSAGGPSGALSAPAPSSTTSSSNRRKAHSSASNAAVAHNVGWNPLTWPGAGLHELLGGVSSDVEHAAMEAVIYGSLLAVGAGLILVGATATARKSDQSSPFQPMAMMPRGGSGGGSGGAPAGGAPAGGGAPPLPAEIPPIPA